MEDLGTKANKTDRKIPLINMDLHYYAHRTIRRFIDDGLLPATGNTVIRLNTRGDHIVPEDMNVLTPLRARTMRKDIFAEYGTEIWAQEAVNAGVLQHVIWIKPPWNFDTVDGHRELENGVTIDVKTLGRSIYENVDEDYHGFKEIFDKYLTEDTPYVLDMEFNFFSADSPYANHRYEKLDTYYAQIKDMFEIRMPTSTDEDAIQQAVADRYKQCDELHRLFYYLQVHNTLPSCLNDEEPSELYKKVSALRDDLLKLYPDDDIDWKYIHLDGIYSSDYILPVHHTKREDIQRLIDDCLAKLVDQLPCPPALIIMAVMYDYDRYTPDKDRDFITKSLEDFFKHRYNVKIEYLEW